MTLKRRKLIFSLKFLIAFGLVGLFIVNIWLPPPTVQSTISYVPLYGIEYLLILSGPIAAVMTMLNYMELEHIFILLGLILLSFGGWLYLLMNNDHNLWKMSLPIIIWVFIGALSTFLGLSASV